MESFDPKTLTGAQLRAGRALVGISAQELAAMAQLGVATIRRAELSEDVVGMTTANASAAITALERAGVVFIPGNGEGPGVRLRNKN